ncbi:DUF6491 family protein [Solimonas terrae]|uniref:Lipoprotein n=1 Tax=Solimonas terrae TaxID=1396819 RepID=A0A6M2BS53_9GAMM|nr:DUF6491 family protein [Solimonas terrae]NGY05174.1 hypothetical protein [Solimonas terrae]
MKRVSMLVLIAALSACASKPTAPQPETLDQKLAKQGYKLGDEVDHIQRWNVDGWGRIDDLHVVFNAGPSRDYLVTVLGPCNGIATATTIGFTETAQQVTKFDKLIVRDIGFTDQCPIESLHELKRVKKS